MHGTAIEIIEAQKAKIYNYKNTSLKLMKTNAAIWLNKISKTKQPAPNYVSIKINGNNGQNNLHKAYVKHLNL